jgi:hypothetical protein
MGEWSERDGRGDWLAGGAVWRRGSDEDGLLGGGKGSGERIRLRQAEAADMM